MSHMKTVKYNKMGILSIVILLAGLLLILMPMYLTIITALKTKSELIRNFFSFPKHFYLGNFKAILADPKYFYAITNSLMITGTAIGVMLFILPMLSYPLSRGMKVSRLFKVIYLIVVAGIFVPFQVRMLPLIKLMNVLHLTNRLGIIILYLATSVCEGTFLYVGFLSSIPGELEDAAYIDGASTAYLFRKIICPLLKPITATVMIKNGLWIWNDFMLPLIMLNKSFKFHTITLFQYSFKTAYTTDYTMAFATFLMAMLPLVVLYIFCQKHIVSGLTNGAVKG